MTKIQDRFDFFIRGRKLYVGGKNGQPSAHSSFIDKIIGRLPFENDYFDTIIIGGDLKRIYDIEAAFLEIYRVIKVNGKLFVIVDSGSNNLLSKIGFKYIIFKPLNCWWGWLNGFLPKKYFVIAYKEKDYSLE